MDRKRGRRAGRLAAFCTLIAMAVVVPSAEATGTSAARGVRPSYDGNAIKLIGVGGYHATGPHIRVEVTACLQKRSGSSWIDVRCNSNSATGRGVRARVSVPGCVSGFWRTTAFGQALGRNGYKLQAYDASDPYRCS